MCVFMYDHCYVFNYFLSISLQGSYIYFIFSLFIYILAEYEDTNKKIFNRLKMQVNIYNCP